MIYPLIELDKNLGEAAWEDMLARETRTLTCLDGHPWEITCFRVMWQKFDYLTDRKRFGEHAYEVSALLKPVLEYEREKNYDLDISFAYWVAETYEKLRLSVVEYQASR